MPALKSNTPHVRMARKVVQLRTALRICPPTRITREAIATVFASVVSSVGGQPICPAPPEYRISSVSVGWMSAVPTYTPRVSHNGIGREGPIGSDSERSVAVSLAAGDVAIQRWPGTVVSRAQVPEGASTPQPSGAMLLLPPAARGGGVQLRVLSTV